MLPEETTVRAACPTCGPVDLCLFALTLVVSHDGRDPRYRYTCPQCARSVEHRTSARTFQLLHDLGAHLVVLSAGPRRPHQDSARTAIRPRCGVDELRIEAFRALLAATDDVAGAADAIPGEGVIGER